MFRISKNLSAAISTALSAAVLCALLALTVTLPFLLYFMLHSAHPELLSGHYIAILCNLYAGLIPAYTADIALLLLLRRVRRGMVFTVQSVSLLRILSWCCIAETLVFLALARFFLLAFLLAFAALFMGLILRVVKNVIEDAAEIKSENDLTV